MRRRRWLGREGEAEGKGWMGKMGNWEGENWNWKMDTLGELGSEEGKAGMEMVGEWAAAKKIPAADMAGVGLYSLALEMQ